MCTQPLRRAPSCFRNSQHNTVVPAHSSFVYVSLLLSAPRHHHRTNLSRVESTLLLLITLPWRHTSNCHLAGSNLSSCCVTQLKRWQESSQSPFPCLDTVIAVDHAVIHTNLDRDIIFKASRALRLGTRRLCSRLLHSVNFWGSNMSKSLTR